MCLLTKCSVTYILYMCECAYFMYMCECAYFMRASAIAYLTKYPAAILLRVITRCIPVGCNCSGYFLIRCFPFFRNFYRSYKEFFTRDLRFYFIVVVNFIKKNIKEYFFFLDIKNGSPSKLITKCC